MEWLVLEDPSTGLAMYRTGQIDCGPQANWDVRQQDLDTLKKSNPQLRYLDWLSLVTQAIYLRTDQPPFNDVRGQAGHLPCDRSPGDYRGGIHQG